MEPTRPPDIWFRRRKLTLIAFCIQNIFLGCELGVMFLNVWVYLETLVEQNHSKLFYGLITAASMFSSGASSIFIGKFADKYRNTRTIFLSTNLAVIGGNILYTVSCSPFFLLAGRLLAGIGLSQRSIMTAEIARSYDHEQISSKLSLLGLCYGIGFILSPLINTMFLSVDFTIGTFRFTFANIPGLYFAAIFSLSSIMAFCLIYNLSQEYDLKLETQGVNIFSKNQEYSSIQDTENTPLIERKKELNSSPFLKQMFSHCDTSLIVAVSFFENLVSYSNNTLLPIIILNFLKWPVLAVNLVTLGVYITSIVPCIVLSFKVLQDAVVYHIALAGLVTNGLQVLIQILLVVYPMERTASITLFVVYCLLSANTFVLKEIFLSGFLAKMVCSQHQSFADSIRTLAYRLGAIAGVISAPFILDHFPIGGGASIFVMFLFAGVVFRRRRSLQKPRIVIQLPTA